MMSSTSLFAVFCLLALQAYARDLSLRENCVAVEEGCKCTVKDGPQDREYEYSDIKQCKKSVEVQTAENKKNVNEEIKSKFGAFRDNCFPRPSGGCKCNVDLGHGEEVQEFSSDAECRKPVEQVTADNKKALNEELLGKFGNMKDNCNGLPSGGCTCSEKDAQGNDQTVTYTDPIQCRIRSKRDVAVQPNYQPQSIQQPGQKSRTQNAPSQNVRDPVRERAQANYAAVLDELNTKFKGLKEGCFPRPKGCLCVIGKTAEGRDITERRLKDVDCKCQAGERGPGCPAA